MTKVLFGLGLTLSVFLNVGCSGKSASKVFDSVLGQANPPSLTSVPSQLVKQTESFAVDIDNTAKNPHGDDEGMTYKCTFDQDVDGAVNAGTDCSQFPAARTSFDTATGKLSFTTNASQLGNFEFKVVGKNKDGEGFTIFNVGIRLRFAGVQSISSITGNSALVHWTAHPDALSYQILQLDRTTGLYSVFKTVSDPSASSENLTGLRPEQAYTLRVQAVDHLGNLDGNVISRSFTTTDLLRFELAGSSSQVVAGQSVQITIRAKNSNGTYQTVGGIPLACQIDSGTSTGVFSTVTDHDDGTYTLSFTGQNVGTPITVGITTNMNFNIETPLTLTLVPGPAAAGQSTLTLANSTVASGSGTQLTALIKDAFGNAISSGTTVEFQGAGGTSTGTFGSVVNLGSGFYRALFTGAVAGTPRTLSVRVNGVTLPGLSQDVTVVSGPASSLTSTIVASQNVIDSGQSATLTAQLRDAQNNPILSGLVVNFFKTGGTSTGDFSSTVTNDGTGNYSVTYTGLAAGTAQTISVVVDGVSLTPTTTMRVVHGTVNGTQSLLSLSSESLASGNFVTLTATLKDSNSNPITSGTVAFIKNGGTSTGTFSTVTNNGNGVYSVRYTGVVSGSAQTLAVSINGVTVPGLSQNVTVTPGVPSVTQSVFAVASNVVSSGNAVSLSATIRDANGNPIASGITVGFTKSGGTSTGNLDAVNNAGAGVYTSSYNGLNAGSAQTIQVIVDGSLFGLSRTVSVMAGAPSALNSQITISAPTVVAGNSVTVTTLIRDTNNNPITSGIVVAFEASGGTSNGVFSSTTGDGLGSYTATFQGVASGTAKTLNATVNGASFGGTVNLQVLTGPPSALTSTLSVASAQVVSGAAVTITATLKDSQNNSINSGVTVGFVKSGGTSTGTFGAIVPSGSGGIYTTTYSGILAGTAQTLGVTVDGSNLGITAAISVVAGAPSLTTSTLNLSAATVAVGQSVNITGTIKDDQGNGIASGITVAFSSTGGTSTGQLSAVTNLGGGIYRASYTGLTKGSAQTIRMQINGADFGGPLNLQVTAGAPHHLTMTSQPSTIYNHSCNGPFTVTIQDVVNVATSQETPFDLAFASPGSIHDGTLYADSGCTSPLSSLSVPPFNETVSFYYKSIFPQTFNLSLNPSNSVLSTTVSIQVTPVPIWLGAGGQYTVNGSGGTSQGSSYEGGLVEPMDLVANASYIYVADYMNGRINRYDLSMNPAGWIGQVSSVEGMSCGVGTPTSGAFTPSWCTGGSATGAATSLLYNVRGVAVDANYLYAAQGHGLLRFNLSTGAFAGWIGVNGSTANVCGGASSVISNWCTALGTGSVIPAAASGVIGGFNTPWSVRTYRAGGVDSLYVSDYGNNRVVKVNADGTGFSWIGQIGSSPTSPSACNGLGAGVVTPTWCTSGAAQASARHNLSGTPPTVPAEGFNGVYGLDYDADYLYVADYNNHRIVRWTHAGSFAGWIGAPTGGSTSIMTPAPSGGYTVNWTNGGSSSSSTGLGFYFPFRLRVTSDSIYLVDGADRVVRVDKTDGTGFKWIGRIAGTPTGGATGCANAPVGAVTPGWCRGGSANRYGIGSLAFHDPRGLEIIGTKILVADRNNARIQRMDLASGTFERWMGVNRNAQNGWRTDNVTGSRAGSDDFSWGFSNAATPGGIAVDSNGNIVAVDQAWGRLKYYSLMSGQFNGYIGNFGNSSSNSEPYSPVAPDDCVGITSGMTPTWCFGGGRTKNGSAVLAFDIPANIISDGTHVYVANSNNSRIDRIKISDGTYAGWIGKISSAPNDGPGNCVNQNVGDYTSNWCIGGLATAGVEQGSMDVVKALSFDSVEQKIYVVEGRGRLYAVSPADGAITAVSGSLASGSGGGCSVVSNAASSWCTVSSTAAVSSTAYGRMQNAFGITQDSEYIYVVDAGSRIMRFNKANGSPAGFISGLSAGTGLSLTSGACLNSSWQAQGYPKVTPGWCYATGLGVSTSLAASSADGGLRDPRGIWADGSYIYVLDSGNNRLSKYSRAGVFQGWKGRVKTTPTGGEPGCTGFTPGQLATKWCLGGEAVASGALGGFDTPTGFTGDAYYLYVLDNRNNRIQAVPK